MLALQCSLFLGLLSLSLAASYGDHRLLQEVMQEVRTLKAELQGVTAELAEQKVRLMVKSFVLFFIIENILCHVAISRHLIETLVLDQNTDCLYCIV